MGDIFRPALLLVSYNYRPSSGCSLAPYNHFSASFCRSDLKRLLSEYEADYSSPRNVPSKAFLCFSLRDIACLNSTYRRTPYSSFPPPPPALPMATKTLLVLLASLAVVHAEVTVYGVNGVVQASASGTASASASSAAYTPAAFNTVVLNAPAIPSPAPATQFTVQLDNAASNVPGLSIAQSGAFFGFSIEMSVVTQVSE